MNSIHFFVQYKIIFVIIHVLAVVVGMGSAIVADLLFNFYAKDKSLNNTEIKTLNILSNIVWVSLSFVILSGVGLFLSDITKYIHSSKFISKMLVMVILLLNGLFIHKFIAPHFKDKGLLKFKNKRVVRQFAFISGAISIISWFVLCILGLLKSIPLNFIEFMFYYLIVIFCAMLVALFIEKITFEK
jgi:uncharacterized membrane protein